MNTRAVRLYGAMDLRTEEFALPELKDDEILVEVISDSVCMSTHKCAMLGQAHKRVPPDVAHNPTIMGHEMAGNICRVGSKYAGEFVEGTKFTLQPALNYKGTMWSPGYSYPYFGGNATYCIIPPEVMELGCFLTYQGRAYFEASLAEPLSCCIGAFHAAYHTRMGDYHHEMGIVQGGKTAIVAGAGPMGLGAVDYVISCDRRPSLLVVADIDGARIARAEEIFRQKADRSGVDVRFVNTQGLDSPAEALRTIAGDGFDDVFVFAPVAQAAQLGNAILGRDGCMNFFAGPMDTQFSAPINLYDVHYNSTHLMGTTGGNTDDLKESLRLTEEGLIEPAVMVTHIGGLDATVGTILNLPKIPGGKKLIYNHISMPLIAIADFAGLAKTDARFGALYEITAANRGLWCAQAEEYLLSHWT